MANVQPRQDADKPPRGGPKPLGIAKMPDDISSSSLGFTFHAKPAALKGKGLNRTAQDAYAIIRNWSKVRGGERVSYVSNLRLAEELECNKRTVQRALATLEGKGLIRCHYQDEDKSIRLGIFITWDPASSSDDNGGGTTILSHPKRDDMEGVRQNCHGGYDTPVTGGMTELSQGGMTELSHIQDSVPLKNERLEKEERTPSSPSSPASAGPNPKTPPAGDSGEGIAASDGQASIAATFGGDLTPEELADLQEIVTTERRPLTDTDVEMVKDRHRNDAGIGLKAGMNVVGAPAPWKAQPVAAVTPQAKPLKLTAKWAGPKQTDGPGLAAGRQWLREEQRRLDRIVDLSRPHPGVSVDRLQALVEQCGSEIVLRVARHAESKGDVETFGWVEAVARGWHKDGIPAYAPTVEDAFTPGRHD